MSDIRFNQWLHNSGTGGVSQVDGGHVGIGTTNPLIPVGAGNTHILNVGVVTCNNISAGSSITAGTFYGSGANLTSLPASTTITVADESSDTTCFPLFATDATGNVAPKSGSNLTFNSSTGDLGVTKVTASNVTSSGTVLIDTTSYSEASGDGDDLIIGSTSDTQKGITIVGSTSGGIGNIFFSDGASYKNQGLIQYRHADDSMRIHVNQNERLRITSTGQLLVGTSSVSNRFKNGNGNGATPKFQFETANVDEQNDISLTFGRNNAFGAEIILAKHRAATVGGYTVVQSGDRLGGINFAGSDGTHFRPAALIQGRVDGTPGTADMPGRLEFLTTADGAATPTERLRISADGMITLGTSTNTTLKAEICNSVGGHYFVSQCDDNSNGFEIYQQHGATNTRAPFAVYDNKTGSKDLSFKIDGAGWAYFNTTSNGTTNGAVDKRYNIGSTNNANVAFQLTTRQRYSIWEHRQIGRSQPRTAQISCGEGGSNQGQVYIYSSTANADVTGGVNLSNGATSFSGNSDMRLKNKTGDILNALEDINKIEPLKFTWKYGPDNNPHVGVSAQSVENVVPEAIERAVDVERKREGDETEYMQVRYTELIPLSIAAIKELKAEVESLKAEIAALKSS